MALNGSLQATPTLDPPTQRQRSLFYLCAMTVSGILPPLGMMLLLRSGGDVQLLAIFLTKLLYVSALTVTVAKIGLDQWAFSTAIQAPSERLNYPHLFLTRIAPLAWCVTLVNLYIVESRELLAAALFSGLFDTISAVRAAELTAKQHYVRVVAGSFINLPLFICLALSLAPLNVVPHNAFVLIFIATTLLRVAVLFAGGPSARGTTTVSLRDSVAIAQQQILNTLLFRVDAFMAAALSSRTLPALASLLYFLRIGEMAFGGAVLACSALGPRLMSVNRSVLSSRTTLFVSIGWCLGCVVVTGVSIPLAPLPTISLLTVTCVIANSILALPVNLCTQVLLARGSVPPLLEALRRACLVGLSALLVLIVTRRWELLPGVCTIQLSAFIVSALLSKVRNSKGAGGTP